MESPLRFWGFSLFLSAVASGLDSATASLPEKGAPFFGSPEADSNVVYLRTTGLHLRLLCWMQTVGY